MKCAQCNKRLWLWQGQAIVGKKVGQACVIHIKCLEAWYLNEI